MSISDCLRLAVAGAVAAGAAAAAGATCESIAGLNLPDTKITTAVAVAAGAFTAPQGPPMPGLPAFCRVAGAIKPSSDSDIEFEVWMPASGWNGKFQGVGNGGFAGSIGWGGLAQAVSHGYAAASTDTGHRGGATDATWALDHPQKIIDFGYRAIHETTEKAKAIIAAYYGGGPKRSYFSSCSNGGRQALMEAQRYPADYDGIIAGAPANYWTHLLAKAAADLRVLLDDPKSYIPAAKIPAVEAAALAACDKNDGVEDGVIDNPPRCKFDPAAMLCRGAETNQCLTAAQVAALKKLYDGPRDSKGNLVFPGYSPGGESGAGGWTPWITGNTPGSSLMHAFGTQFFKNMVFDSSAWDFHTFDIDRDTRKADDKMAAVLNATDPGLKKFRDRGGKLIVYHGWSDAAIAPENAVDYYRSVVAKMGEKDAGQFVRLYMVPGMQHCGGGPGPNVFGQGGVPSGDPQHDMAAALERWVEQGVAPAGIIATKYKNGSTAAGAVERTRPLCPWPQVAKYKGTGSTDDAANFVCVK